MKTKPVIATKYLPTVRLPWVSTAVAYLLLDRFQAPGWAWGAVGVLFGLAWFAAIYTLAIQRQHEITLGPPAS